MIPPNYAGLTTDHVVGIYADRYLRDRRPDETVRHYLERVIPGPGELPEELIADVAAVAPAWERACGR